MKFKSCNMKKVIVIILVIAALALLGVGLYNYFGGGEQEAPKIEKLY